MGDAKHDKKTLNQLYIRFPHKIEDVAAVRCLHPDIKQVFLPRQKSRRWCIVSFDKPEVCQLVRSALKRTKVEGNKKLVVTPLFNRNYAKKFEKKQTRRIEIDAKKKAKHSAPKHTKQPPQKRVAIDSLVDLLKKEERD